MNKRMGAVLAFALVVSLGASFIIYQLVSSRLDARDRAETKPVLVATRDLAVGELIREFDVREGEWVGDLPGNAVTERADLVDRGVVQNIYAGEPFLNDRLAPVGAGAGLAATIPPGMRAVALPVNQVSGVAGFVTPGQRVDILISGNSPNINRPDLGTLTKTLLQNVEVLSAGQSIERNAEGKPVSVPVLNLLLTPEQAEIMSLASTETRIQLVLRNPIDKDEAETPGTAKSKLFEEIDFLQPPPRPKRVAVVRAPKAVQPPPPAPEKKGPFVVEVFHGTQKSESEFATEEDEERKP